MLGRMYDAIEYRGFSQELVETLATYSGVPVYNGLTDEFHPTQMFADVLTMREHAEQAAGTDRVRLHRAMPETTWAVRCSKPASMLGWTCRIVAPRDLARSGVHRSCRQRAARPAPG